MSIGSGGGGDVYRAIFEYVDPNTNERRDMNVSGCIDWLYV